MIHESIWEKTITPRKRKQEKLLKKTDILIIGAGMAGISTAYYLKDSSYQITVLDKGTVGRGVTSKTTGKLTYLQGFTYDKLARMYDKETSSLYLSSQKEAIQLVCQNIEQEHIDCHLEKVKSYVFINEEKEEKKLENEKNILESFGAKCQEENHLPLSYPILKAISVSDTYVFHPLAYLDALTDSICKKGVKICENTTAHSVQKKDDSYIVETDQGSIEAKIVVVCSHYPFFIQPSFIPFKSHIEKSYVVAAPTKRNLKFSAILSENPSYSLRYYKHFLIYGGDSHKMSHKTDYEENHNRFIQNYQSHFQKEIKYLWSTHDIVTEDGMPYIGKVKEDEKNFLLATGFNKWGMTNGTIAGKLLADLILGKENPYTTIFAPYRKYNVGRVLELFKNGMGTTKIYAQTKLIRNPSFYRKNVRVFKEDGIYYGEYIDKEGKKHTVYHKCPHMGCSLLFNYKDTTWDCPCHGSRFDIDGHVIEGPSTYSISLSDKT